MDRSAFHELFARSAIVVCLPHAEEGSHGVGMPRDYTGPCPQEHAMIRSWARAWQLPWRSRRSESSSAGAEFRPKLSIVVVTYKMQREAPRTVLSLLPPLQRCVHNLDYEIIVIDNGSPEPLDLDDILSIASRPVRLVRVAPQDASASPVGCINAAVRDCATGDWLMVCIDGARLASSHLVCRTIDILARHPHAFTFVASRHLGSKPQMQSVREGYDQVAEDKLLLSLDSRWSRHIS